MTGILAAFIAAIAIMGASLIGVLFSIGTLSAWLRRHMSLLATFSAGVFVVLTYHLIAESFHEIESIWLALGSIALGVALLEAIHHVVPSHHHHELADHAHTRLDGKRVLITDALHNVTDGVILVPAFYTDIRLGIAATIGIFLHELVQEISEFFVLRESGYSTRNALVRNVAVSSTILIGVALGYLLAGRESVLALLTGVAAGGLLSLVVRDLIPHALHSARANTTHTKHAVAFALGVIAMVGVSIVVPVDHGDSHNMATVSTRGV